MTIHFSGRRAFTLIELLVVIAIIALLVSILVPSLNNARELARRAVCQTHMRSLGMGLNYYVQDSQEVVPPRYLVFRDSPYWVWYWADFIAPYVDSGAKAGRPSPSQALNYSVGYQRSDGVYDAYDRYGVIMGLSRMMNCPGQRWRSTKFHYTMNISTGWQGSLSDGELGKYDWTTPWRISRYRRPGEHCTITEPDVQGDSLNSNGEWPGWNSTNMVSNGQLTKMAQSPLHIKTFNALMMDGHVNTYTLNFLFDYIAKPYGVRNVPFVPAP